jgi:hypothetical protein
MDAKKPESLLLFPKGSEHQQASTTASKKIFQDLRFLQQFFGKVPDHGNQIVVVNVGEISGISNGEQKELPFGLMGYLESLPQPRLKNLIREACRVSTEKYRSQTASANFLGTTRRVVGWQLNHPEEANQILEMAERPAITDRTKTPPACTEERPPTHEIEKLYAHSEEWKRQKSSAMKAWWKNRKSGEVEE